MSGSGGYDSSLEFNCKCDWPCWDNGCDPIVSTLTRGDRHVVLDKFLPLWLVSPNADVLWADVLVPWEWGWGGTGGGQSTH